MTPSLSLWLLFMILMLAQTAFAASRDEITTTPADQQAISLGIYNNNLALIKDTRRVRLMRDANALAWRGVSAQLRPETAQLRSLSGGSLRVQEQYFDFDLLSPEKLLEAYLGKEIWVIRTHPATGVETRDVATVLSTHGGVVLKFADRVETGVPGRLAFASVPDSLRDTPTLVASLVNAPAGEHTLELSYLSGGLSWLKLGDAFDITADKKQTDFQKLSSTGRNTTIETAYQIMLNNAKKEPVTVTVREPLPGDWTMVSESIAHKRVASQHVEWKVNIPAEGSTTLNYRVRIKY